MLEMEFNSTKVHWGRAQTQTSKTFEKTLLIILFPAIFRTFTGEAKEAILNMDIEKLTEKNRCKQININIGVGKNVFKRWKFLGI